MIRNDLQHNPKSGPDSGASGPSSSSREVEGTEAVSWSRGRLGWGGGMNRLGSKMGEVLAAPIHGYGSYSLCLEIPTHSHWDLFQ